MRPEAIGQVAVGRLPAEVTGAMCAAEGTSNTTHKVVHRVMDLVEASEDQSDAEGLAQAKKEAGNLSTVPLQMELDRLALRLHRGLSLEGRAVLEAIA